MFKVKTKALTINQAYTGRRFKTQKYRDYEKELWYLLPNKNMPEGKLALIIKLGCSNRGFDIDNFVKNFTDICQKKYIFNDNRIYRLEIDKEITKKGEEFIEFEFKSLDNYKPKC